MCNCSGQQIPTVEYTEIERGVWRTVYTNLKRLYRSHACYEHNHVFPLLEENCGYSPDSIPQLQTVSDFLKSGWSKRSPSVNILLFLAGSLCSWLLQV